MKCVSDPRVCFEQAVVFFDDAAILSLESIEARDLIFQTDDKVRIETGINPTINLVLAFAKTVVGFLSFVRSCDN